MLPYMLLPHMYVSGDPGGPGGNEARGLAIFDPSRPFIPTETLPTSFDSALVGSEVGRARLLYDGNVIPAAGRIVEDITKLGFTLGVYADSTNFETETSVCFVSHAKFHGNQWTKQGFAMCEVAGSLYYVLIELPDEPIDVTIQTSNA